MDCREKRMNPRDRTQSRRILKQLSSIHRELRRGLGEVMSHSITQGRSSTRSSAITSSRIAMLGSSPSSSATSWGFYDLGCHGWTLRLRDSINLSVHLSEAAVNPYPTPLSMLKPRNLLPE